MTNVTFSSLYALENKTENYCVKVLISRNRGTRYITMTDA